MKKFIVFLGILLVSSSIFASTTVVINPIQVVSRKKIDWCAIISVIIAILSLVVSYLAYRGNRPKIEVRFFSESTMKFFDVRNNGHMKANVKISNFYFNGNVIKSSIDEGAHFSSTSQKWINLNHDRGYEDNKVHDFLYDIDPLEVMGFIVDADKYGELCSNNGGFCIRDTTDSFQLYYLKDEKLVKMRKKRAERFFNKHKNCVSNHPKSE